jgi:hypothetical protein
MSSLSRSFRANTRTAGLCTAFDRTPLAVRLFAPKRTTDVPTVGVTWMGQEENPAVPTTRQA